jgi:hypothetical protein
MYCTFLVSDLFKSLALIVLFFSSFPFSNPDFLFDLFPLLFPFLFLFLLFSVQVLLR